MIPIKTVVDKANTKITAGGLTDLEYTQLSSADVFLDRAGVKVAANFLLLPSAANNEGIMYYVTNENIYYFSDGTYWRKDFSSNTTPITDAPVYAWGSGQDGALGEGNTTVSKSSPVSVVGPVALTNWIQVASGDNFSLGIISIGIAYAWGRNTNAQLGDGTIINRSSPVTVVGGITNWSQVAAGGLHSLGLTSTGILYAWGYNAQGRLGDNTTSTRSSPVTVISPFAPWTRIAAGGSHSLGMTSIGVAYAWGLNNFGQIGDNTTSSRLSPVTVSNFGITWTQVAAGGAHSLSIRTNGTAYAWGYNSKGMLGDGSIGNRSSPTVVVGGITNWSQVTAGRGFTSGNSLGLTSAGIAYAWGYNSFGQIGDNTIIDKSSPVTVVGGITNWSLLASGGRHSLGLTSTGILYAWGNALNGRLGDGTIVSKSSPVTVVGGITTWSQIAAGGAMNTGIFTRAIGTKGFV